MLEFPREWHVTAHRDSETHDRLCNTVLDDAGYTLVNDRLYEVVTWSPVETMPIRFSPMSTTLATVRA